MNNVVPLHGAGKDGDEPRLSLTERMAHEGRRWVTAVEMVEETGLTYRQVDHWTRTGVLTSHGRRFSHQGVHRHYSLDELARAQAFAALIAAGMTLQAAREHIDEILTVGGFQYGPVSVTYLPENTP